MELAPDTREGPPSGRASELLLQHGPLVVALLMALAGAAWGLSVGLERLHEKWVDEYSYSHGYLVLLMSGWLLWSSLQRRPVTRLGPSLVGLLALLLCTTGYLVANVLEFTLGMQVMLPPILLAMIAALGGLPLALRAVGPVGFLYFAIPVWDVLIRPLQIMATEVVTRALAVSDLTIFIEGSMITTPAGSFEIGDACAGQRFLLVGITLAAFYGLSWYRRWRTRFTLIAIAAAFSVISNWVRIYLLVRIGHATDMQHYLIAEEHYTFGWVIFSLVMIPVILIARRLETWDGGNAAVVEERRALPAQNDPAWRTLLFGSLALVALAMPAWVLSEAEAPSSPNRLDVQAPAGSGWRAVAPDPWRPVFQRPHVVAHQGFQLVGGSQVDLYLAGYARQQADSKLIANANKLGGEWRLTESTTRSALVGQRTRTVSELTLSRGGDQRVVWYWFEIGSFQTHDRRVAKLLEVPALLMGRRDGAAVLVSTACGVSCSDAAERLRAFLSGWNAEIVSAWRSAAYDPSE